jgi:hypothetical protein
MFMAGIEKVIVISAPVSGRPAAETAKTSRLGTLARFGARRRT